MTILTIKCMHCQQILGHKPGFGVTGITSTVCQQCIPIHYPQLMEAINAKAEKAEVEQAGAVEIHRKMDVSLCIHGGAL